MRAGIDGIARKLEGDKPAMSGPKHDLVMCTRVFLCIPVTLPAPMELTETGLSERERSEDALWHARSVDSVLERLGTSPEGLSGDEARERLETHGPNRLPEGEKESAWMRLLRQFHDVLIYILIVAAVVTAFLGEWIDTGVILAVVVINAAIGFVQEGKAEEALESIRSMLSLKATVVRSGSRRQIAADDLVPGDVVLLESGDRVPADLRVIEAVNLHVEEAMLTGESVPVRKKTDPVEDGAALGDRQSMLFSGTSITRGRAKGVVVGTGVDTEIGRIGTMMSTVETLTTPLLRAINKFGKLLSVAILGVGALTFAFGYFFRDYSLHELFLIVVGLAVAAIPEGLPAIMTITLALGVQRMARRNAIIRKLPAVETLGSVTVICSDKTGTLTRNEMTVVRVELPGGESIAVSGTGYAPDGRFSSGDQEIEKDARERLLRLGAAAILSSDAELRHDDERSTWILEGEPTEGALVTLGHKAGHDSAALRREQRRIDAIPFESDARYMATLVHTASGPTIFVKGAPERVMGFCDAERTSDGSTPLDADRWMKVIESMAAEGYRVMAVAEGEATAESLTTEQAESGLTLLGMVGIVDPPRDEAIEAVEDCQKAGIRVNMITGDHAITAGAIARQLGIGDDSDVITGQELEAMDDDELIEIVRNHDVYARTSPEHKLRLIRALQAKGHVVAMTGDGMNDAPALKRADVGVAMGIKGAEASKDASDMVLADDNFASIARAVREGRTIYDNLKKAILFILPTNGAEALIVLASVIFAYATLPITPVQILWVNMVTAVTLALALAFEPSEPGVMRRPPRDPNEAILSGYLLWRISFVSVLIASAAIFLFFRELDFGSSIPAAQTVAVNVLVAGQFFYLFNSRFIMASSLSWQGLFGNPYALYAAGILFLLQVAFTYLPFMNLWFGTEGVRLEKWIWINGAGLVVFLVVEIEKAVVRRVRGPRDAAHQPEP
jgi:magnesium-transporting ATPase (P-type)